MPRLKLQFRLRGASLRDPRSSELVRAIRQIPPSCLDVFVLYRFGGMSMKQVGDHLNIGTKEVETRLTDALVHLVFSQSARRMQVPQAKSAQGRLI